MLWIRSGWEKKTSSDYNGSALTIVALVLGRMFYSSSSSLLFLHISWSLDGMPNRPRRMFLDTIYLPHAFFCIAVNYISNQGALLLNKILSNSRQLH